MVSGRNACLVHIIHTATAHSDPIPYAVVLMNTTSYSDYSKFDPYLFDPENTYIDMENRAFESWGLFLLQILRKFKNQSEKQALENIIR